MSWTLVTGGAKGLGAEICRHLASKGHSIVVHYNKSEKAAENIVKECQDLGAKAEKIQGDFSTQQSVENFIRAYLQAYPLTANLINNVGNWLVGSALNTTNKQWQDLFQTNLHAPFALTLGLVPSLKISQGCIINIGATDLDPLIGHTYSTAYTITKTGLLMLTRSLAKELISHKIRVNMVSPGVMENSVDIPKDVESKVLMGRPAKLSEITRVIGFLLEKESAYITGQNIGVAGGFHL